ERLIAPVARVVGVDTLSRWTWPLLHGHVEALSCCLDDRVVRQERQFAVSKDDLAVELEGVVRDLRVQIITAPPRCAADVEMHHSRARVPDRTASKFGGRVTTSVE